MSEYAGQKLLFVTGRLAESSLREVLERISDTVGFQFEIAVPGVQVAALMHGRLLKLRLEVGPEIDRVIVPGWVASDVDELTAHFGVVFEAGPKNLHDLPEYFGQKKHSPASLVDYNIEIIAEINHATRLPVDQVVAQALSMKQTGANVIDIGCVPGETCGHVEEYVKAIVAEGCRVSVDSFQQSEVESAVQAGAELVLSCNHSNVDWVTKLDTEVVVIPGTPNDMDSLRRLIDKVAATNCRFRIDPIIEPIGMGFADSLYRYFTIRHQYPDTAMMMGVGNITELTDVDSAGVNMILAALCEELRISSILTTQVINWCRSAVQEFDVARRMVAHCITHQVIPKHLKEGMSVLRDARLKRPKIESLEQLSDSIVDPNFRIFAAENGLHLMNRHGHWSGLCPFQIFSAALAENPQVDGAHGFYLGFEMARAEMARMLGKNYQQDEPMSFGYAGTLPGSAAVHHKSITDDVSEA